MKHENKFYTAKYGLIFKNLFCIKPYDNLKDLIEEVTERKVKEIISVETEKENFEHPIDIKNKVMDVYVEFVDGKANIEINSGMNNIIRKRNFIYFANMYISEIKRGGSYENKKDYYQINLSWGLSDEWPLKDVYEIRGRKYQKLLIKDFQIYECNMEKYRKMWYTNNSKEIKKNKFLVALDLPLEDLKEMVKGDERMQEFKNNMERLNQDEDVINFLHTEEDWRKLDREIREEELEEARETAFNNGVQNNKIAMAKKCLSKNMDISLISELTSLTKKEILNIKNGN